MKRRIAMKYSSLFFETALHKRCVPTGKLHKYLMICIKFFNTSFWFIRYNVVTLRGIETRAPWVVMS